MKKSSKKKVLALAITDFALVIYMIIDSIYTPLECECERYTFDDWLFVGPIFFVVFGVCIGLVYYLLEHTVHIGYWVYRKIRE